MLKICSKTIKIRKKSLIKTVAGLLVISALIVFVNRFFQLVTPPEASLPEERHETCIYLGEGLAVIVRDDGELWIWTPNEEHAGDGIARKMDDHVTSARQIRCGIGGYAADGKTVVSEEKVFLGVLYEDSRFAVWEMDGAGHMLSDEAQLICSDVARFQAVGGTFSLVKTDWTVWSVCFSKVDENQDAEGRRKPIVRWETALTKDKSWKSRRGPIAAYQVSRSEEPQYYILTEEGRLWGKGENGLGQLGIGRKGKSTHLGEHGFTNWTKVVDHVVGVFTMQDSVDYFIRTLSIKTDGSLWGWGYVLPDAKTKNYQISLRPVMLMENVRAASVGRDHDLILRTDGTLFARGSNQFLQLGTETEKQTFSEEPLEAMNGVRSICAAGASSYAVKEDGGLWTWGQNDRGQLGHGSAGDPELPKRILEKAVSVTARDGCAAAVLEDGSVWIWGNVRMDVNASDHANQIYTEPICIMEGNTK